MDAVPTTAGETLQLVCSEVWGGNRPIEGPVELPGIRGTIFSRPCQGGRGGDVHYLSVCGSGILSRICIADVVGHGETVAAISSEMHTQLRRAMNLADQRKVLSRLNRRLEARGLHAMTTAAALSYYPPEHKLSVSYAGHPPAWYFHKAADRWERLTLEDSAGPGSNLPLAITPDTRFSRRRVRVELGDRLVVVTDGVLEAQSATGELFGDDRLLEVLTRQRAASTERVSRSIVEALTAHAGSDSLSHDDVTFLVVDFVPGPKGPHVWLAFRNRILRPRGTATTGRFAKA